MDTTKGLAFSGLCLLVCTMMFARVSATRADFRQSELDSLAYLYVSAASAEPERAEATDDRLAVYLDLHRTRIESLP